MSASGNREVGEMIAECFEKVGKNGVVAIEEGKGTETTIEMVEGMQFDRGYASAYFCTNADRMIVEMKTPAFSSPIKKSPPSRICCRFSSRLPHRAKSS